MTDDLARLTGARAVWDFTTGDARRFYDRVSLMKPAAERFLARGVTVGFAMLIHDPATQFVAKTHAGTQFDIEVCLIAMDCSQVARSNLISRVVVEDNVFLNSIALQNKGYACMQVD
jgi:hypothetical protein